MLVIICKIGFCKLGIVKWKSVILMEKKKRDLRRFVFYKSLNIFWGGGIRNFDSRMYFICNSNKNLWR